MHLNVKNLSYLKILFFLALLLVMINGAKISAAQSSNSNPATNSSATSSSATSTMSEEERAWIKALQDPFSTINNFGYDNTYLRLYNSGKINTPPPFGGAITSMITGCFDGITWVSVGPPRPGWYLHTPYTRTYEFGPPRHIGQYLLGLYAPKLFCTKNTGFGGLLVREGLVISMMGSSQ